MNKLHLGGCILGLGVWISIDLRQFPFNSNENKA
jgi:hypothetical protein